MKTLLVGINARYAHSNPAIRSLRTYACAPARIRPVPPEDIRLYENHVNHPVDRIVRDLALMDANLYGFSCYVWNIGCILGICRDLRRLRPDAILLLGGPQMAGGRVALDFLAEHPEIDGIISGEGERPLHALLCRLSASDGLLAPDDGIPGVTWRCGDTIQQTPPGANLDMADLPFPYEEGMEGLENRLVYYETTRGCPIGCSYCLSSVDRVVRARPLGLVLDELDILSRSGIQTVKLVDRTFNANPARALAVWSHVICMKTETTFHFEVAAHLVDDEALALLSTAPPGRIQLEAGIQSIHPDVLQAVHRSADPVRTLARAGDLVRLGNLNVHLDLIAGLPGESIGRFADSFNAVYALAPDALQVGILKILPGTPMTGIADHLGYRYSANAPYRVFSSDALGVEEMYLIEDIGHLVDVYCNSSAFPSTMEILTGWTDTPFLFFRSLAEAWRGEKMFDRGISRDEAAAFLLRRSGYDGKIVQSLRRDNPRWGDDREWRGFLRRRYGFGTLESDIIK